MKTGVRSDILARIVADKAEEVIAAQMARPIGEVEARARALPPPRDFVAALRGRVAAKSAAVIASEPTWNTRVVLSGSASRTRGSDACTLPNSITLW